MSSLYIKICPVIACSLIVSGCATPVPVASHTLQCDVSMELLASKCKHPEPVSKETTYEEMVDVMREDRQALLECGLKLEALRDSIIRCNQQSEQFNNTMDEINRRAL